MRIRERSILVVMIGFILVFSDRCKKETDPVITKEYDLNIDPETQFQLVEGFC